MGKKPNKKKSFKPFDDNSPSEKHGNQSTQKDGVSSQAQSPNNKSSETSTEDSVENTPVHEPIIRNIQETEIKEEIQCSEEVKEERTESNYNARVSNEKKQSIPEVKDRITEECCSSYENKEEVRKVTKTKKISINTETKYLTNPSEFPKRQYRNRDFYNSNPQERKNSGDNKPAHEIFKGRYKGQSELDPEINEEFDKNNKPIREVDRRRERSKYKGQSESYPETNEEFDKNKPIREADGRRERSYFDSNRRLHNHHHQTTPLSTDSRSGQSGPNFSNDRRREKDFERKPENNYGRRQACGRPFNSKNSYSGGYREPHSEGSQESFRTARVNVNDGSRSNSQSGNYSDLEKTDGQEIWENKEGKQGSSDRDNISDSSAFAKRDVKITHGRNKDIGLNPLSMVCQMSCYDQAAYYGQPYLQENIASTANKETFNEFDNISENLALTEANKAITEDWENISDDWQWEQQSEKNSRSSLSLNVNAPEYVPGCSTDVIPQFNEMKISNSLTTSDSGATCQHDYSDNTRSSEPLNDVSESDSVTSKSDRSWENQASRGMTREKKAFTGKSPWGDSRITRQSREILDRLEKIDKEYKEFKAMKSIGEFEKVKEIEMDLFRMEKVYSLAHCVAEDMRMGSGIAVTFKQEFKGQDELLSQKQKAGGLAVIEDKKNNRFVYYLVTKKVSTGKPTYETMWSSLQKTRDHIVQNKVKKLALPRLGCGLDRLEWSEVKKMIDFLFKKVDIEIVVCNFQQSEDTSNKPLMLTTKLVNVEKRISEIENFTTILFFSTEDGHVSEDMVDLDSKFNFLRKFKQQNNKLGTVFRHDEKMRKFILYGCIVRKTVKDDFDFKAFTTCIREINKYNKKDLYDYVAYQMFEDEKDDILNDKILTILRNYLKNVDIYVCWHGKLAANMPKTNTFVP